MLSIVTIPIQRLVYSLFQIPNFLLCFAISLLTWGAVNEYWNGSVNSVLRSMVGLEMLPVKPRCMLLSYCILGFSLLKVVVVVVAVVVLFSTW